jgi:molecular chaperone GrpE
MNVNEFETQGTNSQNDSKTDAPGAEQAAASTTASPEALKIQELEAQVKEKEQKYVYLYADFENYKKRMVKERSDLMKFGWESGARELLEVIDNLERALAHMPKSNEPAHKTLEDGIKMVLNQFRAVLEKQGVHHIKTDGLDFDPNLHEAVGQESSEHPQGHIVREETKGYTIHGRLLRPARVIISAGGVSAGESH